MKVNFAVQSILFIIVLSVAVAAADTPKYSFSKTVDMTYEEAVLRVTAELQKEGFGVLAEIDVQATLKKKLEADMKPYIILGACNPPLALAAIKAEKEIGLFLPCNVIVYVDDEDKTVVSAVDPVVMMAAVENPALGDVAVEVQSKLKRVIDNL
jgi:uncharacterized protein (DUF302 family)